MKTVKLLYMLLLCSLPLSAQEYFTREVAVGGLVNSYGTGCPVDVTESYSRYQINYHSIAFTIFRGDLITKLTFNGYNPGNEHTRHVKVWMSTESGLDVRNWTLAYDNDYTIPHGGTAGESIPLLALELTEPFLVREFDLQLIVECTGETMGSPLFFDYNTENNRPVVTVSVVSEGKSLSGTVSNERGMPVRGAHLLLTGSRDGVIYEGDADSEGHYSIRVEDINQGYIGLVSGNGYVPYKTGGQDPIDLTVSTTRDFLLFGTVTYRENQRATIILPVAPDPEWGRFYRVDRREGEFHEFICFEREYTPQANIPYVIFPDKDFELNPGDYDTSMEPGMAVIPRPDGSSSDIQYLAMYGSYINREIPIDYLREQKRFLDSTPDCDSHDEPYCGRTGGFRAFLKLESPFPKTPVYVFPGESNQDAITETAVGTLPPKKVRDLQGRILQSFSGKGVYICDGKKYIMR